MGVIFDLDQTLVDSNIAVEERRKRNWEKVYSLIPNFKVFDGVNDIIKLLKENNIPICIVTSSPRSYCKRVVEHFGWCDIELVCYHDTKNKKPHKEPIEKGIEKLGVNKDSIISIGDDIKDVIASNKAGVTSIAVTWGLNDNYKFKDADYIFNNVNELMEYICERYMINLLVGSYKL